MALTYYPRRLLYNLKTGCGYPPSDVCAKLKLLKLFHVRSRKKCRNPPRSIETIITTRRRVPECPIVRPYQHHEVPRLWYSLPTLLLSNVTSLPNKLEELTITARTVSAGVLAVTEAWQIIPETSTISDYILFHRLRSNKRGGGVALYCHKELSPYQLDVRVPEEVEVLWVRITPPSHPRQVASLIYCVVYHPPRSPSKEVLIQHLTYTSDFLRTKHPCAKLVLCGDFNEIKDEELQDPLHLTQVVKFHTHGDKTLDKIFTDVADQYLPPSPLALLGWSPHLSVLWPPTPTTSLPQQAATKTYRPLSDSATRFFGQWITQHSWTEVLGCEDVQTKWDNYHVTITEAYHHFFPEKTVRLHPADPPWITHRVKRLMQQRNRAYHRRDTHLYKGLRNKVIREIRAAKKAHYPTKLRHLKQTSISQWYSKIRSLIGSQKQNNSSFPCVNQLTTEEAAHTINNHFASICQQLPPLDRSCLPSFLPSPPPDPVSEFEVNRSISGLKVKRSTTPVDLPMKLYKEFSVELSRPLCSIINASLSQSKCPSDWKISYITPIPKKTNPLSLNELRPIAITPIPSLICEGFVFDRAYADIAESIDSQQFGNMKSSSTTHCLVSLLDFIYHTLDNQRSVSVALTFVDFSKAFDLVNHNVVLKKAIDLGLRPILISWLADFLSERHQAVRFRGAISTCQPLTCGVPQGTKMGPLCFLVLINDALRDTGSRWKYVDDSTIGMKVVNKGHNTSYSDLQDNLNNLQEWTTNNSVTINHSKTVVMHINFGATRLDPPLITLGTDTLEVVKSTKLLGITIDDQLKWDNHINTIIKSSTYRLHLLHRLKSLGLPAEELKNVYNTFILPKLTYASPAWSCSLNISQRKVLERVQKRACKIILWSDYDGYDDALHKLNLPRLETQYQDLTRQFGQKLLSNPRHRNLLPPDNPPPVRAARHHNRLQHNRRGKTERYRTSAIPTIVKMINNP